ncbi:MAG: ComEC/Rec2 family competence protein, partial [Vicinamibacteria bacterium]
LWKSARLRAAVAFLLALGWLWLAVDGPLQRRLHPTLEILTLSVGHGDSHLIVFPDGRTALVDGGDGGGEGFDFGEKVVAPVLLRRGIRRLDYLIATHPDRDHIGGLFALLARIKVAELWIPDAVFESPLLAPLIERAKRNGARIRLLARGDPVGDVGAVRLEILHPPREGIVEASVNDLSLVIHLSYGAHSILFCGDIEKRAEISLIEAGLPLRSTVLKIAHHGSRTSSTAEFLSAVSPSIALVSAGEGNRFGFPHAEVMRRLERRGIAILRTDRDGAIEIRTDGRALRVRTHRREHGPESRERLFN